MRPVTGTSLATTTVLLKNRTTVVNATHGGCINDSTFGQRITGSSRDTGWDCWNCLWSLECLPIEKQNDGYFVI